MELEADGRQRQFYCKTCNKTMNEDNFYYSNDHEKYPEGRVDQCKKCMTMMVDNDDPNTYLWILKELDVPYVPSEWERVMRRQWASRDRWTGSTILGRYLSIMKMKQYRDYRYKDTEALQELENKKIEMTMKRQNYSAIDIAQAVDRNNTKMPEVDLAAPPAQEIIEKEPDAADFFANANDDIEEQLDLTDEDKTYLCLEWGKTYSPAEWVRLERLYQENMNAFDVQSPIHRDNLKLLCKASLKANQLMDLGDVDGAQKMVKMYDSLMKSGNFSAAQNKADQGEYVDSISELVAICETEGFIPRYYTEGPQDKVDAVLQDLKNYTKTLVTEEMGLGNLIENAVKQIEETKAKEAENDAEGIDEDDEIENDIFNDMPVENDDEDYEEFYAMQDELKEKDGSK